MATRALITGVTGMVGSHLADYLLASTDWEVHGMCRWRSPLDNVEHLLERANTGDDETRLCLPPRRPELSDDQFHVTVPDA
ncbi:MAG: GDP-mannose 4,6-dehydratase [Pirellulales bacterium]